MDSYISGPRRKSREETKRDVMALLLGDKAPAEEKAANTTLTLDISDLEAFANHPFKLYEGARLDDMVQSITDHGVIVPIVVRPHDEDELTYEILSGHNRVNAAKIAGLKEVPAIIMKGLTDDEAALIVTETNLVQRSFADLSHSERAIALKAHMDAVKAQGKKTDTFDEIERLSNPHEIKENGSTALIVPKLESREQTAEKYGLNRMSVTRYLRLNHLGKSLLDRVDDNEIGLYPAVSLSYLSSDEQTELDNLLSETAYKVDMKKADSLREHSEGKKLTREKMEQILSGELNKKHKPKTAPPFKLKAKIYQKYFDGDTPQGEIEITIDQALMEFFENHKAKEDVA
jgi:ParB family chromosome partitioning protein